MTDSAWDIDRAKQVVFDASLLKMPVFRYDPHAEEPAHTAQEKVTKLEDFLLHTARHRGDLEEARVWMNEVLHGFIKDWEKLVGWETGLPGGKRLKDATRDDIATAKRNVRPDLWELISDLKHVIAGLSNGIRRLEHDDDVASRAYTFIVGS